MSPESTIDWAAVLSTLFIRFVAVFIVLAILQIGIRLSGVIVSRLPSAKSGS